MNQRSDRLSRLVFTDENKVQAAHDRARSGDSVAREKVLLWAYWVASKYFKDRMNTEGRGISSDPDDLASEFILDLERRRMEVDSICRYTYRALRGAWLHYVTDRQRRLHRMEVLDPATLDAFDSGDHGREEWYTWESGGPDFAAYNLVLQNIAASDRITQRIIEMHWGENPKTLSSIASELGMGESAVRMRIKRFRDNLRSEVDASNSCPTTGATSGGK